MLPQQRTGWGPGEARCCQGAHAPAGEASFVMPHHTRVRARPARGCGEPQGASLIGFVFLTPHESKALHRPSRFFN